MKTVSDFIPVCEPTLSEVEAEYVTQAISSGWISSAGEFISRFESEFAAKVGATYAVSASNGTTALHLALSALGIREGDEVIVPSFTMIASANAVIYCGAKPVFVDVDRNHWTIDPISVETAITKKTKAIMTMSTYGHPCDFDAIIHLARKHNVLVIEDAAEAHGALYKERPLASIPDATSYSFFANKIITTGEGGMVCTNQTQIAERCRELKNLGFKTHGPRDYVHESIGFNYRLTNIQAAIGCAQMRRFDELVRCRQRNASLYQKMLSPLSDYLELQTPAPWATPVYWMFGVVLKPQVLLSRNRVMECLRANNIDSRPFFHPMHLQPVFRHYDKQSLPQSEHLGSRGLYLPSSSHISESQICKVVETLKQIILQKP
jgi:perosamine synthetase